MAFYPSRRRGFGLITEESLMVKNGQKFIRTLRQWVFHPGQEGGRVVVLVLSATTSFIVLIWGVETVFLLAAGEVAIYREVSSTAVFLISVNFAALLFAAGLITTLEITDKARSIKVNSQRRVKNGKAGRREARPGRKIYRQNFSKAVQEAENGFQTVSPPATGEIKLPS